MSQKPVQQERQYDAAIHSLCSQKVSITTKPAHHPSQMFDIVQAVGTPSPAAGFSATPNNLHLREKAEVAHADVIIRIRGGAVSSGRDGATLRWRQRREIAWQEIVNRV